MLNKKRETMRDKSHKNYMGGPSYDLSPFATLYVIATSALFGEPAYYETTRRGGRIEDTEASEYVKSVFGSFGSFMEKVHEKSAENRVDAMVDAINASLKYDPELTIKFLVWLRNKAFIRATSDVGLTVASHSEYVRGTGLIRTYAKDIFARLDDVTNALAYCLDKYGKPIPNSLKRAIADRLEKASPYEIAKYAGKNKAVSLLDAIRLTHAKSEAIDAFCKGELTQSTQGNETWESIISTKGSNHDTWTEAINVMGHMALLRNLRNFEKFDVDPQLFLDKLVAGVEKGKQLPFRYFSAWRNVTSGEIKEALEKCIDKSVTNLPILPGKSLILTDNSGSAVGTRVSNLSDVNVSTCGNLMGILTGLISESGTLGVFGDEVYYLPVNKKLGGTVLQMLSAANRLGSGVGGSTENGIWLALDQAIRSKERFDRIFIYSDMQAGHGGLYGVHSSFKNRYPVFPDKHRYYEYIDVPALVSEYRKTVNPDCKLYSVQIGGYSDTIIPEFYPNTCILGGWSPELLRFVTMYERGPEHIEELFRKELGCPKKQ